MPCTLLQTFRAGKSYLPGQVVSCFCAAFGLVAPCLPSHQFRSAVGQGGTQSRGGAQGWGSIGSASSLHLRGGCGPVRVSWPLLPAECRRHRRHTKANELILKSVRSLHIHAELESPRLLRDDGKRPDGASVDPWSGGRYLVWDFTCADTVASLIWRSPLE